MEISGHSSLAMREGYTHPRELRKIEALEPIDRAAKTIFVVKRREQRRWVSLASFGLVVPP